MPDVHPADGQVFPVKPEIAAKARITAVRYQDMFEHAARDPNGFWAEQSRRVAWMKAPTKIKNASFAGDVSIKWFEDGTLNASASCLDRHLATRGEQTAIIWESDDPAVSKHVTYRELHEQVCRLGNAMKDLGVKQGDRVTIYLPMVVEAAVAMLACARIGAIHSVVFGGFSPDSLANRIQDCASELLITADEGRRGGRKVPLKANADEALKIVRGREERDRGEGDRGHCGNAVRSRPRLRDAVRRRVGRLSAAGDERRGSAVHFVYLGQHGEAEGRAAYHRRLSGVGELHA